MPLTTNVPNGAPPPPPVPQPRFADSAVPFVTQLIGNNRDLFIRLAKR